jgi:hypothetical protein
MSDRLPPCPRLSFPKQKKCHLPDMVMINFNRSLRKKWKRSEEQEKAATTQSSNTLKVTVRLLVFPQSRFQREKRFLRPKKFRNQTQPFQNGFHAICGMALSGAVLNVISEPVGRAILPRIDFSPSTAQLRYYASKAEPDDS